MEEIFHEFLKKFPGVVIELIPTGETYPGDGIKGGHPYKTKNIILWSKEKNPELQLQAELLSERYENLMLRSVLKSLGKNYFISFREIHSKASIALLSSIVHKVNNKLTPIIAYSQLLLRKNPDRVLEKIYTNAQEASDVLNRTLSVFSFKGGECLNVEDVSTILARVIPGDYEKTGSYGNPVLLALVFEELKRNGERSGSVRASCKVEGGHVIVRVENPGNISEEVERKAFNPFFSTEGREGLGLNLVHGIVSKIYGGTVEIKNEGSSTVVELRLPIRKKELPEKEKRRITELVNELLNLKSSP